MRVENLYLSRDGGFVFSLETGGHYFGAPSQHATLSVADMPGQPGRIMVQATLPYMGVAGVDVSPAEARKFARILMAKADEAERLATPKGVN